jgi:hypothetical protein
VALGRGHKTFSGGKTENHLRQKGKSQIQYKTLVILLYILKNGNFNFKASTIFNITKFPLFSSG